MVETMRSPDVPSSAGPPACSCCGRDDVQVHVRLLCHPEVGLCDRCLLWLNGLRVAAARDAVGRRLRRLSFERLRSPFRR